MKQRITKIARKEGHNDFLTYPIGAESVNITLVDGTDLETNIQDTGQRIDDIENKIANLNLEIEWTKI